MTDRYALRVLTPRLELRLPTEDELYALAGVAQAGVHPPERMPFYVLWTDRAHPPEFRDEFVAYHRAQLDSLELGVFLAGTPVGVQALRLAAGVVDTGSWLGARWQNRAPRGKPVVERLYRLGRADWTSPVPVELVGVEEAFSNRSDPPL